MVVWRKELVPLGSETAACAGLRGGQWELGVAPPTACLKALPVPSSPTLGWQEESELFCQTESLPSSVWMRWLLYLAEEVSRHHRRQVYGATGDIGQGNLCQNDKENDRKPQNIKTKDL